ncbi:hypothetical protein [Alistipes finegoldii]|uniref:hypothetical protein n=1 Tax=Alistipes finegoldii TaxID=214856 RepID=UPI00189C820A|nr:hypothetical protein [Alistipes finegoldii]
MDLKYVRSELQKLSEIIDNWDTPQETAALERDLVLEKLRKLYDAVRFGADADFAAVREDAAEEAVAEPAPAEIPVSIDLGEMLSLDPFAVEAQAEPDAAAKRDAVGEAGAAFESESFAEAGASFESESVAEAGAVSESESVSEPEPETVPESKSEFGSGQAVETGVNFAGHSEPAEELAAEPEVVVDSAEAFVAQSDSDGGTNPISEPEISAAEPVTESGPVASEPESELSIEETAPAEPVAGNAAEPAAEQSVPLPETVREPEEASEKPEFIAEPVVESATESFAESLSESVAESVSEPAAESVVESHSESVAEPAAESAAAPAPSVDAEQTSAQEAPAKAEAHSAPGTQPIAPTLFELEEETVRHRHKQRVIMSLYNTEPAAPAPKPASVPALEPTGKPVAGGKPAAEASFAQPAVAGSASSGSAASDSASAGTAAAGVSVSDATAGAALSATPFTAPVTEPAASATTPVGSVTTSLGSATTSAPGPDAFASRTPVAAPQPKAAETTAPDNAGDDDEPDFEEITLEAKNTSGAVLGEVINHNVQTLADTIAPPRDVASELRRSEHVTDLRRAIGINDKFLMIRDLFGGDAAAYEAAIGTLNGFDDFDECMIYIAENYAWNANSDGAKFLMELLERKFA